MVDIVGVRVLADFEFIEIVEDTDPYPAFLGLDWENGHGRYYQPQEMKHGV